MLKNFPEEVINLWNNGEIRGMVLLSLLLQTILIVFGSRRKTAARIWIRILVWSAYLIADSVATFALGNLARSQGDSSGDSSEKANNSIQAFWAPVLLVHLGGPDTITAYSIEDNELWLRHALGLVVQVGVAFYVFSRFLDSGILTFIAIPVFIVGIIKYAERTWVLSSSSSEGLKKSFLSKFRPFYPLKALRKTRDQALVGNYFLQAYTFLDISMFMMQDLVPGIPALIKSQVLISKNKAEDAFKVVEIELGLIYDMLYTKAPLIYSRAGIILRSISFLLTFTAFITFQVLIDKHAYSTIDITITYLLFAAAVFLEFYAFLCLVFSDWTLIWLEDEGWNAQNSAIYSLIRTLTRSKRWSRSIAQHDLISCCSENRSLRCLKSLGIYEKMRQMFVHRVDMNGDLQHFIFGHLLKKAEKMKEDFDLIDKNHRSKIIGQRGDGVLEREGLLRDYKWCTTEVEFSRSILVWHLATEICYVKDARNVPKEYETSRCLSEYMVYLLVMRPNMLSKGISDEGYLDTLQDLQRLNPHNTKGDEAKKGVVDGILRSELSLDDITFQSLWKIAKSVVIGGEKLARQLLSLGPEKRWWMINEVWVEMLAYAAAHCPWKEHTQQLRRGGELLTHVSLLMLHLGLSEQYEFTRFDGDEVSVLDFFSSDQSRKYQSAVEKYAKGIIDMSMSKPVEALYRYLAKTADTSLSGPNEEEDEEHLLALIQR
ncbi:uncharacterized protein LOC133675402 isoform X2 [Populus nigra]|uniref:uncharacterized protein LOC133675402 isoform X2 n=1 Tax=Populus nigra TaxID=3691 RepID=UPI002B2674C4|nr:uncharacterized protein LOC133675402 isoform X2 [Populus nigra]XP_061952749.1 uncharacterized protein LOC133675402 isoform X2 [Populus nigra]XP_061952750.1 uncharacterized protein LOC133675402 isoform X2 [Populus nigra]